MHVCKYTHARIKCVHIRRLSNTFSHTCTYTHIDTYTVNVCRHTYACIYEVRKEQDLRMNKLTDFANNILRIVHTFVNVHSWRQYEPMQMHVSHLLQVYCTVCTCIWGKQRMVPRQSIITWDSIGIRTYMYSHAYIQSRIDYIYIHTYAHTYVCM